MKNFFITLLLDGREYLLGFLFFLLWAFYLEVIAEGEKLSKVQETEETLPNWE